MDHLKTGGLERRRSVAVALTPIPAAISSRTTPATHPAPLPSPPTTILRQGPETVRSGHPDPGSTHGAVDPECVGSDGSNGTVPSADPPFLGTIVLHGSPPAHPCSPMPDTPPDPTTRVRPPRCHRSTPPVDPPIPPDPHADTIPRSSAALPPRSAGPAAVSVVVKGNRNPTPAPSSPAIASRVPPRKTLRHTPHPRSSAAH
jgi:hypothetical protein